MMLTAKKIFEIHKTTLCIISIILLGVLLYANSLHGAFLWDDQYLIIDNASIKSWSLWPHLFVEGTETGAGMRSIFYRPILMLTLMMDYSFWKFNVVGYHITTIICHVAAALAVLFFIRTIFSNQSLAFLTSLLFLIHPVQTEDVAYITGRADSLALLWMMLTLIFYITYEHRPYSFSRYFLILFSFLLALFSKENCIIVPFIVLLYHIAFRKKIKIGLFISLLVMLGVYLYIRAIALSSIVPHLITTTTFLQRIPGFFVALASYVRIIIFPFNLHLGYGQRIFAFWYFPVFIGSILFLVFLACGLISLKKSRAVFFSVGWFFICLFPVSNIFFPASSYMAERYLYFSGIGIFLLFAQMFLVIRTSKYVILRIGGFILIMGALLFFSLATIRQNEYWLDPIAFYEKTINIEPDLQELHINLGNEYLKRGKHDKAISAYKKAIALAPLFSTAYGNLGVAYRDRDVRQSIALFRKNISLHPQDYFSYHNLGVIYDSLGNYEEALLYFEKASELNPFSADVYCNLGLAYGRMGNHQKEINSYLKAIEVNPMCAVAYHNLGLIVNDHNKKQEAVVLLKKAISINPDMGTAYYNIGCIYQEDMDLKEARTWYQKAISIEPKLIDAYINLALLYIYQGEYKKAIAIYETALAKNSDIAKIHNNLAALYFQLGNYDFALNHALQASALGYSVNAELLKKIKERLNEDVYKK